MGRDASDDKIVDVFAEYDLDGSGQLELKEFLRMCARRLLDVRALREWMRGAEDQGGAAGGGGGGGGEGAGARAVALLAPGEPGGVDVIFSAEELEEALAAAEAEGGLVCLMCGLSWCRPCKGVAPAFAKLAERYGGGGAGAGNGGGNGGGSGPRLKCLKVYGNSNSKTKAIIQRLKIRSTPAFVFFRDGKVVGAVTGANKGRLESAVREALGEDGVDGIERLYPPGDADVPAGAAAGGGDASAAAAAGSGGA